MDTIGKVDATTVTIYPSASALAADNDLRIASLTMAAYEYVVDRRSQPLRELTHLAISSPFPQNISYISPRIAEGWKL